ncbi:MAG: hypothetical protein Q8P61_06215, partial [Candidatus Nanopelagicales bacterium]|nr:hypothetical protein [Candidatus Nanopelagicales bacterium]
ETTVSRRVVAYCVGAFLATLAVLVMRFLAAPVNVGTGILSAIAVVVVSLVIVVSLRRAVALPAVLGAMVVAIAASVMGAVADIDGSLLLFVVYGPTLFTVLIASTIRNVAAGATASGNTDHDQSDHPQPVTVPAAQLLPSRSLQEGHNDHATERRLSVSDDEGNAPR